MFSFMKNTKIKILLVRFTLIIVFLWAAAGANAANLIYAQSQSFTFNLKNSSIETVFKTIEQQSEFIFMYLADLADISKKVSIAVKNESLISILDRILKGTSLTYEINDRQVIIKQSDQNELNSSEQSVRKKTIQGLITDELTKEPIIGAAIQVKGTTNGTTSDIDGSERSDRIIRRSSSYSIWYWPEKRKRSRFNTNCSPR